MYTPIWEYAGAVTAAAARAVLKSHFIFMDLVSFRVFQSCHEVGPGLLSYEMH
jgi:hypothetical protein